MPEFRYLPALTLPSSAPLGTHKVMKYLYLPAILPTTMADYWKVRPVNWMDPRAGEAYYPYALLSYYHWRTSRFTFEPEFFVFGDSGGYSIATLGANIDPTSSLRWQILNCSVGVILDVPPYINQGSAVLGGSASSNWERALRTSALNTAKALPLYLEAREMGSDFRWWGVAHGETPEQLDEWHSRIADIYPFADDGEGWALKVHPANDTVQLARVLRWAKSRGIRRVHFLQMTGTPALATLYAFAEEMGLEFASYDSASSSFSGINRTVFVPHDSGWGYSPLSEKFRETEGVDRAARDYMMETCECQSCEWFRADMAEYKEHLETPRPKTGTFEEYVKYRMIFHNTLMTIRTQETLQQVVAEDSEAVLSILLGKSKGATVRALRYQEPRIVSLGTPISLLDL